MRTLLPSPLAMLRLAVIVLSVVIIGQGVMVWTLTRKLHEDAALLMQATVIIRECTRNWNSHGGTSL